jgi:hypothetical protein
MKRFSLVAVAGAVALLAPLGVTASAQAQVVDRSHEHITDTFEVQLCGLDLVSTVDFVTGGCKHQAYVLSGSLGWG